MIYPMGFYVIVGLAILFGIWRMVKKNVAGCQWKIAMAIWVVILLFVADWALKITQWLVRPFFAELVMVAISLSVFFVLALAVWLSVWLATRRFNRWWDANAGKHV